MNDKTPFYHTVACTKVVGGRRPLWHAHKPTVHYTGAGNSADNAIRDLQRQINAAAKEPRKDDK